MSKLIIIVGPSGAGKSSFVEKVVTEIPHLVDVITCTTRDMRDGESQGKPYYFLTKEDFEQKIADGYFVEHARVHDNFYGTPKKQLEKNWAAGNSLIMDVDIQGAETFIKKYPKQTKTVFVLPPSIDVLRQRIVLRDGREAKDLELRLENGKKEIAQAHKFDYQLVNDDFSKAYTEFKKIIENILSQE